MIEHFVSRQKMIFFIILRVLLYVRVSIAVIELDRLSCNDTVYIRDVNSSLFISSTSIASVVAIDDSPMLPSATKVVGSSQECPVQVDR